MKSMQTEYEATFTKINKDKVRRALRRAGAKRVRKEFKQKRVAFDLPKGHEIKGGWLRVRDEGDRITLSLKVVAGQKIADQKEICLTIDDFAGAVKLLSKIGARGKAYQETKRELWRLGRVEITIDTWPFLEPLVEIEGPGEAPVREVAVKLGFAWSKAKFCSIDTIYSEKYGVSAWRVNHTARLVFGEKNPFE